MSTAIPNFRRALCEAALLAAAVLFVAAPLFRQAVFMPDDYRYLYEAQSILREGLRRLPKCFVVENRWDRNWWLPDDARVRFFRPPVILTFLWDYYWWRLRAPAFAATNIMLHLLAVLLVWRCLALLIAAPAAALVGALAFAVGGAHFENLGYISGRTDTLAGLASLAAIYFFLKGRSSPSAVWDLACTGAFFAALLCKEYCLLMAPLLWLYDRRSMRRRLYLGLLTAAAAYFFWRRFALGPEGAGAYPFPYFYLPNRPGFWPRAAAVWTDYGSALVLGLIPATFIADSRAYFADRGWVELLAAFGALPLLCLWSWRTRPGRWFVLFFAAALLPLLPLYSSGRYLYLPSFAYCGMLALLWQRLAEAPREAGALLRLLLVATQLLVPALHLFAVNARLWTRYQESAAAPTRLVQSTAALRPAGGAPVLLFDFPYSWLDLQFLPYAAAVLEHRRELPEIYALSYVHGTRHPPPLELRPLDGFRLEASRSEAPLCISDPFNDFEPRPAAPGDMIRAGPFRVQVLAGGADGAARVIFGFEENLCRLNFGRFRRLPAGGWDLERLDLCGTEPS